MKIITIFPKDSEALFNRNSKRTFGGADVQMYLLTKELKNKPGIDVSSFIVNYDTIDFDEKDHFDFIKTYNEKDNILKKIFIYHHMIKQEQPSIIIQRGLTLSSCFLSLYCKIKGVKFIFMFAHDIESHGRYQKNSKRCLFFPLLLYSAHRLIVQNEYELNQLNRKKYHDKIKIIKKSIDFQKIVHNQNKIYDAIWIGRCEPWKQPDVFIDLAEKHKGDSFVMVCSKVKGKEQFFQEIQSRAQRSGNIIFIEFIKNEKIYELLAQSKVFCITSKMEGDWPMTVLEATASGLPVLSLHLNYGELIDKFNGGFYCQTPENLTERYSLMINDQALLATMSDGAVHYSKKFHDLQNNIDIITEYIN